MSSQALPAEDAPARPRLRGWLHASAAPAALVVAVWLVRMAEAGAPRVSVAVFGAGLVGLYAVSGTYHVPRWSTRVRTMLGRMDVAMIQLFIAASFTPFAVHVLQDTWRTASLVVAWTIAVIGAGVAASPLKGPRWLGVAAYTSFGALAALPLLRMADRLPVPATALVVTGALVYLLGGIVYARRRPDPWPEWLGFHEVFHGMVVLASAIHVVAIWRYVLPLA